MRIFLSYASENRPFAEEMALALRNDGHEVFFDRAALSGGEHYHQVIREQLAASDLLLFLITHAAVEAGSYALSELRAAEARWPSPAGHVVPVLLEPMPLPAIPAYLRAVTLLEPRGNAAAEVAAHVERLAAKRRKRRWGAAVAGAALAAILGAMAWQYEPDRRPSFESSISESDFVTAFLLPEDILERTEYSLEPGSRFPDDQGDVVRLERLAFGRLANGRPAFHLRVSVNNVTADPIQLDLTTRFFDLRDDRGEHAPLLYFCCEARGDIVGPGQQRIVTLVYASLPGWEGKETTPGKIYFHISGLLPVVRATWSFRPLATAA
jgi:hypothetical protein